MVTDLSGNCRKFVEYQCISGECIDISQLCDGIEHCRDGSDETEFRCRNEYCPGYAFQCAYGACVSGEAKCDRKKDCADASDETEELCGYKIDFDQAVTTHLNAPPGSCVVPESPENGYVVYAGDPSVTLQKGNIVLDMIEIEYRCSSKYVLIGNSTNYCLGGVWLFKTPKCESETKTV